MDVSLFRKPIIWWLTSLSVILTLHLGGVYIYEWGKSVGVRWGSINIWLIGEAPEIPNPLNYGGNKQEDLILKFLFRPLIKYDALTGEYQGDIGTCDLSDLSKIHCELKNGQTWSDGTNIQTEDILASYQAFRELSKNEKLKTLLASTSFVSDKKWGIDITSKEKNSIILELLTAPIIRSDMIERIKTDRITKDLYITSGPYAFLEKVSNEQYGYDRITLVRNESNLSEGWLDKYHFLFFPNLASLERSIDTVTIIVPPARNEFLPVSPRFAPYEYRYFEYFWLFQNTDRLNKELRQHFSLALRNAFSGKIEANEYPINSLFPYEIETDELKVSRSLTDVIRERWYQKPDDKRALLDRTPTALTGGSVTLEDTPYFTGPKNKKYQFGEAADGTVLLAGNVPAGIRSVYINNYELKEFRPGNTTFAYRVSLADGTLKTGENTFTLEFADAKWGRMKRDEIEYYYSTDPATLEGYRNEVTNRLLSQLNTPEKILEREKALDAERQKLLKQDPRYYFNGKWEVFTIKIYTLNDPSSLEKYADLASQSLEAMGIKTERKVISPKELDEMLKKGEKNYDIILAGFESVGRLSKLGQLFLSTEAKNGINFSKIESKNLDSLFAKLRTSGNTETTRLISKEIENIFQNEGFFIPISSPIHRIYIDKNLKGIRTIPVFQDSTTLHSIVAGASIKDTYLLELEGKSLSTFWNWMRAKQQWK